MKTLVLKLIFLAGIFFLVGFFASPAPNKSRAAISSAAAASTTVTYQKGDGKGIVSETDDGTIYNRFIEGRPTQIIDFEGAGNNGLLTVRHHSETVGTETRIDTQRFLVKFPNIIGAEVYQIPTGSTIESAKLKLVVSTVDGDNLRLDAYRVRESWTESVSGYLNSPNWRQRLPSIAEYENLWTNPGADTPTSTEYQTLASGITVSRTPGTTIVIDITAAMKAWMQNEPNEGIAVRLFDERVSTTRRLATFYSSESEYTALRPILEVTYTPPAVTTPPPPPAPTPATQTPPPPAETPSPAPAPAQMPAPAPAPTPVPTAETPAPADKTAPDASSSFTIRIITVMKAILEKMIELLGLLGG